MSTIDPLAPAPSEDDILEGEQEKKRIEILEKDAARTWRGTLLQPWSEERARLLDALCAADVPGPDLSTCTDDVFFIGYFPRAVKMLYLMHHKPEEWQPHRQRLLRMIDLWGIENVPGDTFADKVAAVTFALDVERAHRDLMVVRRPEATGRSHSGN